MNILKRKGYISRTKEFDEFGYEWFITEKKLAKLSKGNITANWCPETKTIEVMRLFNGSVMARKSFGSIQEFDNFNEFLNPSEGLLA